MFRTRANTRNPFPCDFCLIMSRFAFISYLPPVMTFRVFGLAGAIKSSTHQWSSKIRAQTRPKAKTLRLYIDISASYRSSFGIAAEGIISARKGRWILMAKKLGRQKRPSKSTEMKSRLFGSEFYGHHGQIGKKGGSATPEKGKAKAEGRKDERQSAER